MIPTDILFSPLAIAGFATGIVVAFLAGRVRGDPGPVIVMSAIGSGLALAGLAWANAFGGGPLSRPRPWGSAQASGRSAWSGPGARRSTDRGRLPSLDSNQ
jgi:hypothetical protein